MEESEQLDKEMAIILKKAEDSEAFFKKPNFEEQFSDLVNSYFSASESDDKWYCINKIYELYVCESDCDFNLKISEKNKCAEQVCDMETVDLTQDDQPLASMLPLVEDEVRIMDKKETISEATSSEAHVVDLSNEELRDERISECSQGPNQRNRLHFFIEKQKDFEKENLRDEFLRRVNLQPSDVQESDAEGSHSCDESNEKESSLELEESKKSGDWLRDPSMFQLFEELESKVRSDFSRCNDKWPEGNVKASFTYLLIDPRRNNSLVEQSKDRDSSWITFVESIFYIGKGKEARSLAHLKDALKHWTKQDISSAKSEKDQKILDIWSANKGVVRLQVFQNRIAAEAYTYEAAMIDFIGRKNLTNLRSGTYYGVAKEWGKREQRLLGQYLLYKAMKILSYDGERQIRPEEVEAGVSRIFGF